MNNSKTVILWMIVLAVLFSVFSTFQSQMNQGTASPGYSDFLQLVDTGRVKHVTIIEKPSGGRTITYRTSENTEVTVDGPRDDQLINDLWKKKIPFKAEEQKKPSFLYTIFINGGRAESGSRSAECAGVITSVEQNVLPGQIAGMSGA